MRYLGFLFLVYGLCLLPVQGAAAGLAVLHVEEAIEAALEHHPDIIAQQQRLVQSLRQLELGEDGLRPTVSVSTAPRVVDGQFSLSASLQANSVFASGASARASVSISGSEWDSADVRYQVSVEQPLRTNPDWVAVNQRISQAELAVQVARRELEIVSAMVPLHVLQAFFNLGTAEENLGRANADFGKAKEELRKAEVDASLGLISSTELLDAQIKALQREITLHERLQQHTTRKEQLSVMLGAGYEQYSVELQLPYVPAVDVPACLDQLLVDAVQVAPAVWQAQYQLHAARLELDKTKRELGPRLAVRGQIDQDDWWVRLDISHSLSGHRTADVIIAQAQNNLVNAENSYQQAVDGAQSRVLNLWDGIAALQREQTLRQLQLEKARQELIQAEELASAGLQSQETVLVLADQVRQRRLSLEETNLQLYVTVAELRILGGAACE